jgi:hypothetical protein
MTHDASCPMTAPTVVFTTERPVYGLVVGSSYVYAELANIFNEDASATGIFGGPTAGILGCAKPGCGTHPATIVDDTMMPGGVTWTGAAANDGGLYYGLQHAAGDASVVIATNPDGGDRQRLVTNLAFPLFFAADDSFVYWTDDPSTSTEGVNGSPWSLRAAKIGTPPVDSTLVFTGASGGAATYAVFLDAKNVYVLADTAADFAGLYACARLTADGGGCGGSATSVVSNIGYDDYYGPVASFAADGEYVYEANLSTGTITSISLSTHEAQTLATGQLQPAGIVVAGGQLYWFGMTGVVYHMPADGSAPAAPFTCALDNIIALAVDSERLYVLAATSISGTAFEVASLPLL